MLFLCWNSQSFHLHTGWVSRFTTQATSWTGSFRTFIVHGPWTGSKIVRVWLRIEYNTFCWQPVMEIPSFFLANRALPSSQKLPLNGIWKKHIRFGNKFECVEGVTHVIRCIIIHMTRRVQSWPRSVRDVSRFHRDTRNVLHNHSQLWSSDQHERIGRFDFAECARMNQSCSERMNESCRIRINESSRTRMHMSCRVHKWVMWVTDIASPLVTRSYPNE